MLWYFSVVDITYRILLVHKSELNYSKNVYHTGYRYIGNRTFFQVVVMKCVLPKSVIMHKMCWDMGVMELLYSSKLC